MLHDIWQSYDLSDATVEILTMLLVAFLLGLLLGYIIWGRRINILLAENEELRAELNASGGGSVDELKSCEERNAKLQGDLTALEGKIRALEASGSAAGGEAAKLVGATPVSTPPAKKDNLKRIEGIGPKIESILNENGVYTFKKLSGMDPEQIRAWLLAVNEKRYRIHDPSTWPDQAAIAADGDWKKLKEWQDQLKGGKKV